MELEGIRTSAGEAEQMEWGAEMDGKETDMNFVVGCFSKHNLRNKA